MLERNEELSFKYRFQKRFGSIYTAVIFLLFGALCWDFGLSELFIIIFSSAFVLTLLFCKDVNNIFAYLLYAPFFIESISVDDGKWYVYVPCVIVAAVSVMVFMICKFVNEKSKIKLGGMFYPLIAFTVAMLIGGAAGNFKVSVFLIFLGFCVEILFFYLIAVNYTRNFSEFLSVIFIVGAFLIFVCSMSFYIKNGGDFLNATVLFIVAENINTAAIFIALGMAGCFYLGVNKKRDYFYALLSLFLFFVVITTRCRTMTVIAAALLVAEYAMFFIFSENKRIFLFMTVFLLVIVGTLVAVFFTDIQTFVKAFFKKGTNGLGGRRILWDWCIDRFNEYPYFGYGYVSDERVPTIISFYPKLVLAHNTALQWLTSTGVVGTAIAVYFYCGKYYTLFNGFNKGKIFHALSIFAIALSGSFDQSATMDVFVVIATFALIAAAEKSDKKEFISTAF